MKYKWTEEQLIEAVGSSRSYRQILIKLGLFVSSGNYRQIKKYITERNLDTSHLKGAYWSKGLKLGPSKKRIPLEDILVENSTYKSTKLAKRLINEGYFKEVCTECGLKNQWNNKPLVLHLDHVNGNPKDNRIENLRLLCPNCHSQTGTYCRGHKRSTKKNSTKKRKLLDKNKCLICKRETTTRQNKYCSFKCSRIATRKVKRPSRQQLIEDVFQMSLVKVGEKYGVSDNAIRKWLKSYKT